MSKREEYIELRNQGKTYQEIADIYGVSKQCIHQTVNFEKNKERLYAYKREYAKKHPEIYRKSTRKWLAKHPNYQKAYYKTHKEKISAANKKYREKLKEC